MNKRCRLVFAVQLLVLGIFGALWIWESLWLLACASILQSLSMGFLVRAALSSRDLFKRVKTSSGGLPLSGSSMAEKLPSLMKNYSNERQEREAILDVLAEGVATVDAQLLVRTVNSMGSRMLGMPKRHLIGRPFPVLQNKNVSGLQEKARLLLLECLEKQVVVTGSVLVGSGNKKVYLDLIASPFSNGGGAALILQDQSNHYKILEMGKDFVANASHELRTPITIIKGFAETLQDLPEVSPEMLAGILEKMVRNCQRMENLVKNLLILTDIDTIPSTRFQPCDLVALAENCRHVLISIHPSVEILIEKEQEHLIVPSDADLLELALINLLTNGVKYSHSPARLTIRLKEMEEEACIEIEDRGIGIPAKDLGHVFDRFYTVDKAHSRRLGGSGLGLSIVKTIIEKHDGTIQVSSTVGKGTCFSILLPKERIDASASH